MDDLTQSAELDGTTFTITKFTGEAAFFAQGLVARLLAPALEKVAALAESTTAGIEALFPVVGALLGGMTQPQQKELLGTLLANVSADLNGQRLPLFDGKRNPTFNTVTQGRPELTYQLLWWAADVNFRRLFDAALVKFGALTKAPAVAPSATSSTSPASPSGG